MPAGLAFFVDVMCQQEAHTETRVRSRSDFWGGEGRIMAVKDKWGGRGTGQRASEHIITFQSLSQHKKH